MNKTQKTKKGMSTEAMVGIGAGIAVATVAGYLLFGPEGKKNRKAVKGWAVKMKGEIIEKLEAAKELSEPVYNKIIDEVQAKYAKVKNMDKVELAMMVADMRKHWKAASKTHAKPKSKKSVRKSRPKAKRIATKK